MGVDGPCKGWAAVAERSLTTFLRTFALSRIEPGCGGGHGGVCGLFGVELVHIPEMLLWHEMEVEQGFWHQL